LEARPPKKVRENRIMKKKKILIATGLYPPEEGGPAAYAKILYDKLPEYGISVDVVPFRRVRFLPKIIRHLVYFFIILWRGLFADVIYALDPVSVGFPSFLAAKILGNNRFVFFININNILTPTAPAPPFGGRASKFMYDMIEIYIRNGFFQIILIVKNRCFERPLK